MNYKPIILATTCWIFFNGTVKSQDDSLPPPSLAINSPNYNFAAGLRGGITSGLTIKYFTNQHTALEGILGIWYHGLSTTLLYEKYVPAFDVSGLKWYYGAGGHISFVTGHTLHRYDNTQYHYHEDGVGFGADGLIGIEYKAPAIPFAFSFDLKPFVEVNNSGSVWMSIDPGIGVKVTF